MAIRVALIGPGGVGKTEIMRRIVGADFRAAYVPTHGSQMWVVTIENIQFIVTDYSGQEQLRYVPQEELDAIESYILVMTESDTVAREAMRIQAKMPSVPYCVVVNKTDVCPSNYEIQCCAKTNTKLTEPFIEIAKKIYA
jgi:small GTP-binding protein